MYLRLHKLKSAHNTASLFDQWTIISTVYLLIDISFSGSIAQMTLINNTNILLSIL